MTGFRMAVLTAALFAQAVDAQPVARAAQGTPAASVTIQGPSYARLADLADRAEIVAVATVRSVAPIPPGPSATAAPGLRRLYIEADVTALIRGPQGVGRRLAYLADVPVDARGRTVRLDKQRVILFARGNPGDGTLRLVAPTAQLAWSADTEARTRGLIRDLLARGAPPRITGIGDAFHVAGAIPGEGETQIFLRTANDDPVSLSILRRVGEPPRWSAAFGEIVDEAARAPAPATLGWFRLACGLPRDLPAASTAALAPADAAIVRADYRFVRDQLGLCDTR